MSSAGEFAYVGDFVEETHVVLRFFRVFVGGRN